MEGNFASVELHAGSEFFGVGMQAIAEGVALGEAEGVIVPDVLVQPHMASLEMVFYPPKGSFPKEYDGDAFAAEHGSWNRANRAGYEVISIPMRNGHAADGSYEDFLTGFVTKDGQVWGRPVEVTVGGDGALDQQ